MVGMGGGGEEGSGGGVREAVSGWYSLAAIEREKKMSVITASFSVRIYSPRPIVGMLVKSPIATAEPASRAWNRPLPSTKRSCGIGRPDALTSSRRLARGAASRKERKEGM